MREPLAVGTHGSVSSTKLADGWIARTRYRDRDGVTRQVSAVGATKGKAETGLRAKLRDRARSTGRDLNGRSKVKELADVWFATVDKSPGTKDVYRYTLDSDVIPRLGALRLEEVTTGLLDRFLSEVGERGPSVPLKCRVVLGLMFGLAARHDAIPANPVRDTRVARAKRTPVKALTVEDVARLRSHVVNWAAVRSDRGKMLDAMDLFIATGLRPGELLAVRYSDIDLQARTLTVTGTVKRTKSEGLYRQEFPKSEHGERVLLLPEFAVRVLARRQAEADPGQDLVFPNRVGTVQEPANFRRAWREARGEEWETVKPSTFRKAVATLIERELDSKAASRQLGHSSDQVTKRHYIERDKAAGDFREVLDMFRQSVE